MFWKTAKVTSFDKGCDRHRITFERHRLVPQHGRTLPQSSLICTDDVASQTVSSRLSFSRRSSTIRRPTSLSFKSCSS